MEERLFEQYLFRNTVNDKKNIRVFIIKIMRNKNEQENVLINFVFENVTCSDGTMFFIRNRIRMLEGFFFGREFTYLSLSVEELKYINRWFNFCLTSLWIVSFL